MTSADGATSVQNPRLVIVDVLARFRSGRAEGQKPLWMWLSRGERAFRTRSKFTLTIIVMHHVRKGHGDIRSVRACGGTLRLTGATSPPSYSIGVAAVRPLCPGRDVEEYEGL